MESIFSFLFLSASAVSSAILALIILFSILRGTGRRYVNRTRYVVDSFDMNPSASTDEPFLHVAGRHEGLIAWIMTLLGIETKIDLTVTAKEWKLRAASLSGMNTTMAPLKHIEETVSGYQRSIFALFLTLFFAIQAIWIVIDSLLLFLRMSASISEAAREATARHLATSLGFLIFWLVCFAAAGTWYYFSKRLSLAVKTTHTSGIVFKRSLIGNNAIEYEDVEEATWLLDHLVKAAAYGEPGKDIPPFPTSMGLTKPQSALRPWQVAGGFGSIAVLLIVTGVLLRQYGDGVVLDVHTSPTGAAVYLDGQYSGMTNKSGDIDVKTTRRAHALRFDATGYAPLNQTVKPGTLEPTHTVKASLSLLHFPITVATNPSNSNVFLDGKPAGTSDGNGRLELHNVSYGTHYLEITHAGFEHYGGDIQVQGKHRWDISLESDAAAALQVAQQQQQQAQADIATARSLFQQGNYQAALQSCDAALTIDPSSSSAHSLKAKIEQTRRILGK